MNKLVLIIIGLSILNPCLSVSVTPTERYLAQHTPREICQRLFSSEEVEINPKLFDIASQENDSFVAYHGTTRKVSLIHDIAKAIIEKVVGEPLPDSFTFLRIPGDRRFTHLPDVKGSFFSSSRSLTPKNRRLLTDWYVFRLLNEVRGSRLSSAAFTDEELMRFDALFEHFAGCVLFPGHIDLVKEASLFESLAKVISSRLEGAPCDEIADDLRSLLSFEVIASSAKGAKDIKNAYELFFQNYGNGFGYDPKKLDEYRIKMWTEGFAAGKTFDEIQQLIHEESPYPDYENILSGYMFAFYDSTQSGVEKVVSCSVPLLGGRSGEDCVGPFLKDVNYEGGERYAENDLYRLAEQLKMPKEPIRRCLMRALDIQKENGVQGGVLYQIFDDSSPEFSLINRASYLAIACGHPIPDALQTPSAALMRGAVPFEYGQEDVQLRIICDNATTLNPWSGLKIVKHSFVPEAVAVQIDQMIHEVIRDIPLDEEASQNLKSDLDAFWSNQ